MMQQYRDTVSQRELPVGELAVPPRARGKRYSRHPLKNSDSLQTAQPFHAKAKKDHDQQAIIQTAETAAARKKKGF